MPHYTSSDADFDADLEQALAGVPAGHAAQVREACARWTRLRFAIDATPYPRPDAECSPERGHVHHDACRCDGTRKTIPGWEYQFLAAVGHLRTAWAALVDVERTTAATRTRQTIGQVTSLLRRLHAAGHGGRGAPLVVMDAGYSAAALTAALAGQPVHLLIRLASGSVFYADPVTWPGKHGRPGKHGTPVTCHNDPGQPNPEPDESLMLPGTPRYGTVRVEAWHQVHPLLHGDRGYFAGWDGDLPILHGTVLRVTRVDEVVPAPYTVLGWEVSNIEEVVKWLQKRGVAFEKYPFVQDKELGIWTAPTGDKVAWFKDPDGNVLSVSQHK